MGTKDGYIRDSEKRVKRYCQFLKLNPDTLDQYKYWHDSRNIWKEIPEGIRKAGISDMEIYTFGDMAFMIVETVPDFNWDESFSRLATYERQAEWEEFVSQFQQGSEGKRSDEKWQLVERIFSLTDVLNNNKTF
ncbi:L-rhamnose mutarotase [Dysgonomonas sp. PFB1-18]|uniref:L-rhamnose mutarotase n=1 Tax=unclassified Dysgonomonas TaxID=2630389 RepID=UPI0024732CB1|nr:MULTISPECIES: L-rhamnose mutarotase [unclassified Dysgonomonas]MDH6310686.1 L-rhamnose mutarotase [Dysgonomonas sp. PF1-14]MDH6340537.1 L-rhamnose mutarotase [Dysgonomonas sp. PF1-16]MDH6382207.1 L-rhamnose mutarotase [Dysgonomonas sp. PFB1-18]MDH6399550.1 L-rhamnose mutarotase [Dysgonomonas sp. PF1-23]